MRILHSRNLLNNLNFEFLSLYREIKLFLLFLGYFIAEICTTKMDVSAVLEP